MKKSISLMIALLCLFTIFGSLTPHANAADTPSTYYIVNKSSKKFHLPSCSYLPDSSNSYRIRRSEINKPMYSDLSPCSHCKPLTNDVYAPKNPGQSTGSTNSSTDSYPSANNNSVDRTETFSQRVSSFILTVIQFVLTIFLLFVFILHASAGIEILFDSTLEPKKRIFKTALYSSSSLSSLVLMFSLSSIFNGIFSAFSIAALIVFAISFPTLLIYSHKPIHATNIESKNSK